MIPKVVSHLPFVNFRKTWKALNLGALTPHYHDTNFLLAHNVLPVNVYLFNFNISRRKMCYFCTSDETFNHLFFECIFFKSLWSHVDDIISRLSGVSFSCSVKSVLYYDDCLFRDDSLLYIFIVLSGILKRSIWMYRNQVKFDKKVPDFSKFSKQFWGELRFRCQVDFSRFSPVHFGNTWARNEILSIVISNELYCLF